MLAYGPGSPVFAQPELTEADPVDGSVLEEPPEFLHLCFTEPVNIDDQGDWRFNVRSPQGSSLGLRIVFEPGGGCVDVYPGFPPEPPEGIWNFEWLVHAQSDGSEASGVIRFQLGSLQPGETPLPSPKPLPVMNEDEDGGGGSAVLLIALIVVGAAVAVAATAGFVIARRRPAS
jgi:hypothetical protein